MGGLHVIGVTKEEADRVKSQLSVLQRSEISNPPSHGARIVRSLTPPTYVFSFFRNIYFFYARWVICIRRSRENRLEGICVRVFSGRLFGPVAPSWPFTHCPPGLLRAFGRFVHTLVEDDCPLECLMSRDRPTLIPRPFSLAQLWPINGPRLGGLLDFILTWWLASG